jgi:hypothetical protein
VLQRSDLPSGWTISMGSKAVVLEGAISGYDESIYSSSSDWAIDGGSWADVFDSQEAAARAYATVEQNLTSQSQWGSDAWTEIPMDRVGDASALMSHPSTVNLRIDWCYHNVMAGVILEFRTGDVDVSLIKKLASAQQTRIRSIVGA